MPVLLRIIVPGWPQYYQGRLRRGRRFFGAYVVALLLGLFFAGTNFGSLLLGLALALHACSVLDVVLNEPASSFGGVAFRAAACLLVLTLVVYVPLSRLVLWVATPMQLLQDSPPFAAGDVILYSQFAYRSADPQPGDIVLCDIPTVRVPLGIAARNNAMIDVGGLRIERLLAGPGTTVHWAAGRLSVDGQPADWLPLSLDAMPAEFTLYVAQGCYLMVPAPLVLQDPAYYVHGYAIGIEHGEFVYRRPFIVARAAILGKVYFRTQPLQRFGSIR